MTTPTWTPLLLNIIYCRSHRPPPDAPQQRLRLLAGDSEANSGLELFPLRVQRGLTRQPVRLETFVVLLEFRLGLTVRNRLPGCHRIESPSIGLIRDLLFGGSLCFYLLLFHFD